MTADTPLSPEARRDLQGWLIDDGTCLGINELAVLITAALSTIDAQAARITALEAEVERRGEALTWALSQIDPFCVPEADLKKATKALAAPLPLLEPPEEWVMVPREPNERMFMAYYEKQEHLGFFNYAALSALWPALVAASPSPPVTAEDDT